MNGCLRVVFGDSDGLYLAMVVEVGAWLVMGDG